MKLIADHDNQDGMKQEKFRTFEVTLYTDAFDLFLHKLFFQINFILLHQLACSTFSFLLPHKFLHLLHLLNRCGTGFNSIPPDTNTIISNPKR